MPVGFQLFQRIKGQLLAAEGSLKAKVFRGGAWLGVGSLTEQVVRFGRSIILARLLAPEAFGVMAVVLSASTLIHSLTDIGVREAIIQNPRGGEDEYIDSAFWLALGRALALAACIFLVAPWLAKFYGNAELVPLLRVASLGVLIDGAWSPRMYIAIKQLRFSRFAAINHGGGIAGVIFTVIFSYFIRDVWALVIGSAVESFCRVALSYAFYPYLPKIAWHRDATRDLLHFSRGLFGLSFLNLIFAKTDIFVLAKLYSPTQLGLYSMAIYLAQTPTSFIMNLLGQTMLPTYAHIRGDQDRENRILLRVTSLIFVLGMPVILFVYFCGRSVLDLAFGGRYSAAAPALAAAAVVSASVSAAQAATSPGARMSVLRTRTAAPSPCVRDYHGRDDDRADLPLCEIFWIAGRAIGVRGGVRGGLVVSGSAHSRYYAFGDGEILRKFSGGNRDF